MRLFKRRGLEVFRLFSTLPQFEGKPVMSQEINAANLEKFKHEMPLQCRDYFNIKNLFTIKDLFDARVHYGHKEGSVNQDMLPFLYGSRLGHTIFDLDITAFHLRQALNFCAHIAFKDGVILFICRNAQFANQVESLAEECKEFAHTRYWRTGTFTNSTPLFGAVTRLPDLCIFINTLTELLDDHPGVVDAAKMNIPTIAVVDSNCNPNLVTYPIPGNDDSPSSINLYCNLFKKAILKGKTERLKLAAKA